MSLRADATDEQMEARRSEFMRQRFVNGWNLSHYWQAATQIAREFADARVEQVLADALERSDMLDRAALEQQSAARSTHNVGQDITEAMVDAANRAYSNRLPAEDGTRSHRGIRMRRALTAALSPIPAQE